MAAFLKRGTHMPALHQSIFCSQRWRTGPAPLSTLPPPLRSLSDLDFEQPEVVLALGLPAVLANPQRTTSKVCRYLLARDLFDAVATATSPNGYPARMRMTAAALCDLARARLLDTRLLELCVSLFYPDMWGASGSFKSFTNSDIVVLAFFLSASTAAGFACVLGREGGAVIREPSWERLASAVLRCAHTYRLSTERTD